jgi:hypothetical protein
MNISVRPPLFTHIPLPNLPSVPQHFVDRVLEVGRSGQLSENEIMPHGQSSYVKDRDVIVNGVKLKSKIAMLEFLVKELGGEHSVDDGK